MLRHLATAFVCAVFTLIDLPAFFDLTSDHSRPVASATTDPNPPRIYGKVQPVGRSEQFAAFAAADPVPPRWSILLGHPAAPKIFSAFDPQIYRSGRVGEPLSTDEICEVVEEVAAEHDIPVPLFVRLIWQESRFRNETVSRAGAQGIAQFMPETAAERGLDDPFDPLEALPASAHFLRELTERFGNFGLAAAAYNSGPQRVRKWLAGRARLPKETRDYVLRITGRDAEHWARAARARPRPEALAVQACDVQPINAALQVTARSRR
ncbi:MAG TPA: lytic transglycosylase domain-containing protein [Xanthobacteraceae bacterium]|jgi:hypothetical protein